ncbi:unnamed protein product [Anisakis simplex]|uniref:ATP synthase peripheral stalk subunit OSCP, mitochondrial n=1 Tax=Anisakis simplex TaxID=6269 RepID=A0A0M3J201_ANISI|nr:unnamed protein product [Anisakis simplex]VDK64472.1 unnamed protein product [Anisakis simplex]
MKLLKNTSILVLMAENGRLKKLDAVLNTFEAIMHAHRGELFVQITTAAPLTKSQETSLNEALKKFAKAGETLHVTTVINPEIIGGLIVNIGDRYVDMSIASKIKKYELALRAAV